MFERFLKHLENEQLLPGSPRVLLAISGGIDSMVMLHLFGKMGIKGGIVHINFMLRGEESDKDEQFVRQVAMDLGWSFFYTRFNTRAYSRKKKISIQLAARELRYRYFEEVCLEFGYEVVATAHNLDDSVETFLFNLVRGTGLAGLSGIPVKTGPIIRPLLFASREEIKNYARDHQVGWREDSSNRTTRYSRNFIRHKVLPQLKKLNPHLLYTLQTTMMRIKSEENSLEYFFEEGKKTWVVKKGEHIGVAKKTLQEIKEVALLYHLIKDYGFSYTQSATILEQLEGQPGLVFYSASHILNIDREDMIISPLTPSGTSEVFINREDQWIDIEGYGRLEIGVTERPDSLLVPGHCALFDMGNIQYPLRIRNWKTGDWFVPFGMKGRQKLSDYLIDRKIPRNQKKDIRVLENNGEIMWVIGWRTDDRYKVKPDTDQVLNIKFLPRKGIVINNEAFV